MRQIQPLIRIIEKYPALRPGKSDFQKITFGK